MRFPVSETKQSDLEARMAALGIAETDLIENFIRGSGAGGQKINKTSVAVWLKHTPSGTEVRCQESRSQALNRFLARRMLVERLEAKVRGETSERQQEREKIRRQKRKRSRRAQEKMLTNKRYHAHKKGLRRPPREPD